MTSRPVLTTLFALMLAAAGSHALAETSHPEVEPNDTPAAATPLHFHGPAAVATGSIIPAGDHDFYSFQVPANSYVWILADSGGTAAPGTTRDTLLTLYASDGTTVIESDNNDGTGTGGDATIETLDSSALAGVFLANAGTYYIRVAGFQGTDTVDPYELFVLSTYGSSGLEDEPNDSILHANTLGVFANRFGVANGAISSSGDVDVYVMFAHAGETLLFGLDADPERDGGNDLAVDVLSGDGSVILTANSSPNSTAAAESANYVIPTDGSWYLRVRHTSTGTGNYVLAAALLPPFGHCITTIASTLGEDSSDYPAVHGTLPNALLPGTPTTCFGGGPCPGTSAATGPHAYDAYTFFNHEPGECVTVRVDAPGCSGVNAIQASAYFGSFDPDDPCATFMGQVGSSPEPYGAFSFGFGSGSYVVVVNEVNAGAGCPNYTLAVERGCAEGLVVDAHQAPGTSSNQNGLLESGETVLVQPAWRALTDGPVTGAITDFFGQSGPVYGVEDAFASYGSLVDGEVRDCFGATQDCYEVTVSGARPAQHWDAVLEEETSEAAPLDWLVHVGGSFADVPSTDLFYPFIENIFHNQVTGGGACGGYCPNDAALRKQMAVFVLKAKEGPFYIPPPATNIFVDVPSSNPFAPWIEELYHRGVVAGCVPGVAEGSMSYCPDAPVLRQQMAVFLLKTLLGTSYAPPPAVGLFSDVPAASPFAPYIEDLSNRGIAAGCGNGNFCPANPNLRKQMAPFLVKTFGLVLYGH